jgi:hypothetical protein
MKFKLLTGLLLALSWASPALANIPAPSNNWVVTGQAPGHTALVDAGTVARNGHHAGFWFQMNYANKTASRLYVVANCMNQTYQPFWSVVADQQGRLTQNESVSHPPINIPVGSLGDTAYKYACFNNLTQADILSRDRQTNAEAINRAMQSVADMFR